MVFCYNVAMNNGFKRDAARGSAAVDGAMDRENRLDRFPHVGGSRLFVCSWMASQSTSCIGNITEVLALSTQSPYFILASVS